MSAQSSLRPVICVVGARPNFMKMAPILRAMAAHTPPLPMLLVHTGQHYDPEMSARLFQDLRLPAPDLNLEVGAGTHASQTAEVMRRFEPVLEAHRASCVLVVGDVNSTLACALVAAKKGVPVAHVEAGLRSHDRSMPEEINRLLTDQIADRLYTTERSAQDNLLREGIAPGRICFVGNVMIDSVQFGRASAPSVQEVLQANQLDAQLVQHPAGYGVVTLHRPSNVDQPETLRALLAVLAEVATKLPLLWVLHPRTRGQLERLGLMQAAAQSAHLTLLVPQGYLNMLGLVAGATVVLTDSGGLQEETTALGVPCLTLRENTERPITVTEGTNVLVGRERHAILTALQHVLDGQSPRGRNPELWDGHAGERIVADLWRWLPTLSSAATAS